MTKFKKSLCVMLSVLMLLSILVSAPITVFAGAPSYFHPGIVTEKGYWYAWTWSDGEEGSWRTAEDENGTITFYGLSDKVVFVLMDKDLGYDELDDKSWGYTIHQSDDITVNHTKNHFTATKWTSLNKDWNTKNFSGVWSDKEVSTGENPMAVTVTTKKVKASALKKAAKTVKPLKITGAKGTVKVTKVKSGTSSKIYKKISVKAKTGEIKIKKGSYKAGTYKVKLKITAAGNADYDKKTINKTVKIKILGKSANTVSVTTKLNDLTVSNLKKAKKTVKPVKITKAKGKVVVKKVKKGTSGALYKKIKVNAKTGAITLKKGTYKKGNYKVKLKVTAKGNADYKSKSVTVTANVRIANKFVKCSSCDGYGYVYTGVTVYRYIMGMYAGATRLTRDCDTCHGTGKVVN